MTIEQHNPDPITEALMDAHERTLDHVARLTEAVDRLDKQVGDLIGIVKTQQEQIERLAGR